LVPDWYAAGIGYIWRPYAQTATAPLAVIAARGSRIVLADGRELIGGVASWGPPAMAIIIRISPNMRVRGAIGVVEMHRIKDVEAIRARFIAEGVFVRPLGNVIYLTPAFTIRPTISRY
jgi:adenosylmethionine-8-amino-7-oxononanoate aminotransferase